MQLRIKIVMIIFAFNLSFFESNGQIINLGDMTVLPGSTLVIESSFENSETGIFINNGDTHFYRSIDNQGFFGYNPSITQTGLIQFLGAQPRVLSGVNPIVLWDGFLNSDRVFLEGTLEIDHSLDFYQGIIDVRQTGGSLIFQDDSFHLSTSDASHVDGPTTKVGNDSFLFPNGSGDYHRSLQITAPLLDEEIFTSEYHAKNSNDIYNHDLKRGVIKHIDTLEYWTLSRDEGNSNVVITISWNTDTTDPTLLANLDALTIVRWDDDLGYWVDEPSIIDSTNQSISTITSSSNFGFFALGVLKTEVILPGGLVVYNALTPNGDGKNDFLLIDGIEMYPDNTLEVFNRWGVKVFETSGYNNIDNTFRGFSEGRITINQKDKLPSGTYFYVLKYDNNGQNIKKAGYLYINGSD